ncbi:hypothetical protein E3N88_39573 [Mikania micrantha]|uniref:Retrotransposon gag domain-containing protein n=1 Tax=Mikania micrantha TaxID=192012 RepID=A0A5N6LX59_9ASTR|nr:hypothetical protein E3N88_39573 [Mikania micrantha]
MAGRVYQRRHPRRTADRGNEDTGRDPRDIAEIARLQQRIRDLEFEKEERDEETQTDSIVGDYGEDEGNPFGQPRQFRPNGEYDPLRSMGIKIEIPYFDGRAQPDEFLDWLSMVERVFDLKDIPDAYKVKLVAIKLRKSASLWWEHVKRKRLQEGKSKIRTWDKMKKLLREKFLPVNYRQDAFLDYHNLAQRTSSVEDMIADFDKLRMRCRAEEEEQQVIARFLGALRPEIADIVQLQPYWTFNDVCLLALRVEKQLKTKNSLLCSGRHHRKPRATGRAFLLHLAANSIQIGLSDQE